MKKRLTIVLLLALSLCSQAQVKDAFSGILPVTDRTQTQSLNGTWQLKVIEGISDKADVPQADATWGTIPVPGCWEAYGFCKPSYDHAAALTGYYRTAFTLPEPTVAGEMLFSPLIFVIALAVCMVLNLMAAFIPAWLSLRNPIVESIMVKR